MSKHADPAGARRPGHSVLTAIAVVVAAAAAAGAAHAQRARTVHVCVDPGVRWVCRNSSAPWELLPITGLAGNMDAIQTVLSDEQKKQFKPVAIELKKGQCAFHHPLMVHGSYENSTPGPRRAVVINACRDGVASASDQPLLDGVPPVPPGQKLGGQFFPLLFDPAALPVS